jgi:hypothetical protein
LLAKSAASKANLPIDSPPVSLRLKAKNGIVAGRDAAAWVRAFDIDPVEIAAVNPAVNPLEQGEP